ncbi:uncharacterized protein TM35_000221400 [Trypanosoma theileri]|uniref:Uncharacterized protein n=1 Tax=Trypanosoma theileri TaxID=67003 RepID=A0A1X0NRW4_9TRYP|nr:uncharacterized protein TM35_000221400 [Trypanosoma theileri]ORC87341.1 hypothetical protein TM35_000221400 [Trypanosoma theileri]
MKKKILKLSNTYQTLEKPSFLRSGGESQNGRNTISRSISVEITPYYDVVGPVFTMCLTRILFSEARLAMFIQHNGYAQKGMYGCAMFLSVDSHNIRTLPLHLKDVCLLQ